MITGEAIGQVSSQTLSNLRAIDDACERPVLRPLIGHDKHEIIALCRKIGTHDLSVSIEEYCQLVPDRPSTSTRVEIARYEEAKLDLTLIDEAVERAVCVDLSAQNPHAEISFCISHLPQGAVLIDCRSEVEYRAWHAPQAKWIEFYELMENWSTLDPQTCYVIYCEKSLQSSVVAGKLQQHGYRAFAFGGGVTALQQLSTNAN